MELLAAAVIGLLAGTLGGLAGVGGSMIMLPGLALVLGFETEARTEQHLYMAAAMAVNMLVALPAAHRHHRAGAVRWDLYRVLVIAMGLSMVVGVVLSNAVEGLVLKQTLALFIASYCVYNIVRLRTSGRTDPSEARPERTGRVRLAVTGVVTGLVGGLLGLGGGVIMVPMLQMVCGVRLRSAIATSLTLMPVTALLGATLKIVTLGGHGLEASRALVLVAALGPTAMVGGHLGASLTHAMPVRLVRVVISVILFVVAVRMAGLWPWEGPP